MICCNDNLILHVDVDAFFASIEQLLIPALGGRPVIVGSGCIASCSYEARRFGLRAGMSLRDARRLCPQAVVLAGDYPIYRCFAEHIWDICRRYATHLETHLDEAYGDAGGMTGLHGPPPELGDKLRRQVLAEAGLSVSVGLAANRMLAKMASSAAKPGGVRWIAPDQVEAFLSPLPARKLPGVGRQTAAVLDEMNIATVAQLRELPRRTMEGLFGLRGLVLYERCRGEDPQVPRRPDAPPRTLSRETTFHQPICDAAQIRGMLFYLLERAVRTARTMRLAARTVELTLRYDDWKQFSAARSLPEPTAREEELFTVVLALLGQLHRRRVALRHVGLVLSNFSPARGDDLLTAPADRRRDRLHEAVDAIRRRWGHAAVVSGQSINLLGRLEQNDYGFVLRTPSLTK
jgi:DNA polymerase-4